MEAIGSLGLAANVLQFIDFTSRLVANSSELYKSNDGLLDENRQIEIVTNDLVLLNAKIKEAAVSASNEALRQLSESCKATADELITALNKLRIDGNHSKRKTIRKAVHAAWCKENLTKLETRLSRFRSELNLHILVSLRKDILQLYSRASDQVDQLDSTTRYLFDALIEQRDIFEFVKASHRDQWSQIDISHARITSQLTDEHKNTCHVILEGVRAEHKETRRALKTEAQDSRQSRVPGCWLVSLSRNSHFVGRMSEIERLEARLFHNDQCSRTAVIGLGGIGKTQVALELAYRTRDKYSECSIFWIPALSIESVRQAYFDIARQLGIVNKGEEDEDIWGLVQGYLSQSNVRPWLLIIDNADDLEMFRDSAGHHVAYSRLTDILPKNNGSSIILTTRSRKAAVRFANDNIIHLSELDGYTATELLNQSVINKPILDNSQVVMQLLKELTFLPLAIIQAAAYINENDITVRDYVSLLQSKEEEIVEILSEDFENEGRCHDHRNPIASTWLVSFEQIRTREPLAADYLSFMSCLDPKAIPKSLLPLAPTKKKGIDAFGLLSAYSFISQRPGDNSFDLHRLVHLATRNWLRKQGILSKWTKKVIKRLAEVFPDSNEGNRILWRSYIMHVHHIQASSEFQDSIQDYLPFLRRYGKCLMKEGRWTAAEATLKQQKEIAEFVLGMDDPFTLTCMTDLALTRGRKGYVREAINLLKKIIVKQEKVLGSGHIDVFTTVGNLAIFYSNKGLYDKAEDLSSKILSRYGDIYRSEHPYILECKNNLAVVYSLQGHYEKSVKLHHQILDVRKRVLGLAHPRTLQSMSSLSLAYINQGLTKEAIKIDVQALMMKKKVLGWEHPDLLINTQNLAVAHDFLGQHRTAKSYGESLVNLSSKLIGGRHPSTLRSLIILAILYVGMKKWDKSEELLNKARRGLEKLAGADHPDTSAAIFGLVAQYLMQNRLDEAEKLAVPLLEQRQRVAGPEHPGTLLVMNELANIWRRQGGIEKATELKEACLGLKQRILGTQHPLTIRCISDLSCWRKESLRPLFPGPDQTGCIHQCREFPSIFYQLSSDQYLSPCSGVAVHSENIINKQEHQVSSGWDAVSLGSSFEVSGNRSIVSKRENRESRSSQGKKSDEQQDYQTHLRSSKRLSSKRKRSLSSLYQHRENQMKLQAQPTKQINDLTKAGPTNHDIEPIDDISIAGILCGDQYVHNKELDIENVTFGRDQHPYEDELQREDGVRGPFPEHSYLCNPLSTGNDRYWELSTSSSSLHCNSASDCVSSAPLISTSSDIWTSNSTCSRPEKSDSQPILQDCLEVPLSFADSPSKADLLDLTSYEALGLLEHEQLRPSSFLDAHGWTVLQFGAESKASIIPSEVKASPFNLPKPDQQAQSGLCSLPYISALAFCSFNGSSQTLIISGCPSVIPN